MIAGKTLMSDDEENETKVLEADRIETLYTYDSNDFLAGRQNPVKLEMEYWQDHDIHPYFVPMLPEYYDRTPWNAGPDPIKKEKKIAKLPDASAFLPSVSFVILASILCFLDWSGTYNMSLWISKTTFESGEWWRAITALFGHADIAHLTSNAGLVIVFGFLLSGYFGNLGFPFIPMLIGVAANIATVQHYPESTRLLGASGMLYGMVGLWLTIYLFKEENVSWGQKTMRVLAVALMLLFPTQFDPKTSYLAHGYGFLFGIIAGGLFSLIPTKPLNEIETRTYH